MHRCCLADENSCGEKGRKRFLSRETIIFCMTEKRQRNFWALKRFCGKAFSKKTITSDSHVRMDFLEPDFSETDSLSGCVPKKCLHHLSDTWQSMTAEIRETAEKRDRDFRLLRETVRLFECKRVVGIVYKNNGAQYAVRFNLGNSRIFIEE